VLACPSTATNLIQVSILELLNSSLIDKHYSVDLSTHINIFNNLPGPPLEIYYISLATSYYSIGLLCSLESIIEYCASLLSGTRFHRSCKSRDILQMVRDIMANRSDKAIVVGILCVDVYRVVLPYRRGLN
jgi:hypothetical protein